MRVISVHCSTQKNFRKELHEIVSHWYSCSFLTSLKLCHVGQIGIDSKKIEKKDKALESGHLTWLPEIASPQSCLARKFSSATVANDFNHDIWVQSICNRTRAEPGVRIWVPPIVSLLNNWHFPISIAQPFQRTDVCQGRFTETPLSSLIAVLA